MSIEKSTRDLTPNPHSLSREVAELNLPSKIKTLESENARLKKDVEEHASYILKLHSTVKYMVGIAERGTGETCPPDIPVEKFVLDYVKRLEKDLEQFQMALREQVEMNKNIYQQGFEAGQRFVVDLNSEDVPTIAYLNGVAEGKRQKENEIEKIKSDLRKVQAALDDQREMNPFRKNNVDRQIAAAYRAAADVLIKAGMKDGDYELYKIQQLTPADAEKALREFAVNLIVDWYWGDQATKQDREDVSSYVDKVLKP